MDLIITILSVVTKELPISPRFTPYDFLSRCKFNSLTTRQPMAEFYLLTFPRFPLRKKDHKFYFGKNRTHDFRISRCAGYLLDHWATSSAVSTGATVACAAWRSRFSTSRLSMVNSASVKFAVLCPIGSVQFTVPCPISLIKLWPAG